MPPTSPSVSAVATHSDDPVTSIKVVIREVFIGGVPLEVGMSVTAEAQAGSQTVLQYLLTPLARIADEAMHER